MPSRPSRRTVVAALAGVATVPAASVAGCTLSGPTPRRPPTRDAAEVDPDVALLRRVAAATEALIALYEAVLQQHRGLRRDLRPLLEAHRAHARALGEAAPPARGRRDRARPGGRSPQAQEPQAQEPRAPDVPSRPAAAVRALRAAEDEASRERLEATGSAVSGAFARLLASMSAASAQHARVLAGLGDR